MLQAVTVLTLTTLLFIACVHTSHTHLPIRTFLSLDAHSITELFSFLIVRLGHVMYYQSHGTFLFI